MTRKRIEALAGLYSPLPSYHEARETEFRKKALETGEIRFHEPSTKGWANGQLEAVKAVDILNQVRENNRLPGAPTIIKLKAKVGHYPSWSWAYAGLGHDYAAVELRWGEYDADIPYGPIGVRIFADVHEGKGVGASFTGDNWTKVYQSEDYLNFRRLLQGQRRIGDVRDLLLRKQIDLAMGLATPDKYFGREPYIKWEVVAPKITRAA